MFWYFVPNLVILDCMVVNLPLFVVASLFDCYVALSVYPYLD